MILWGDSNAPTLEELLERLGNVLRGLRAFFADIAHDSLDPLFLVWFAIGILLVFFTEAR